MKRTYGTVAGADEFFEAVSKEDGTWVKAMPSWMSTHPGTQDRLKAIKRVSDAERVGTGGVANELALHGIPSDCP